MSLYFAVFSETDDELEGFQVGTYHDYGKFIDVVKESVEPEHCSLLVNHHDSDGYWSSHECESLIKELNHIKETLSKLPPKKLEYDWSMQAVYEPGDNLNISLQNVDGEPIVDALAGLCEIALENNAKLYFQ